MKGSAKYKSIVGVRERKGKIKKEREIKRERKRKKEKEREKESKNSLNMAVLCKYRFDISCMLSILNPSRYNTKNPYFFSISERKFPKFVY